MYYDLNVKGSNYLSNLEVINELSKFNWNHINFSYLPKDFNLDILDEINKSCINSDLTIDFTLLIKTNNSNKLQKTVNKFRMHVNCISVLGGDLKINRSACENIKVDVLSKPYFKRRDSGMNHVLAKEACENNVAVELSFFDVLSSYGSYRSKIISNFKEIIMLHRKFDFPLILSSGAQSFLDLRSAIDIAEFFKSIGLSDDEIECAFYKVPKDILDLNSKRENLIFKGVKEVNK